MLLNAAEIQLAAMQRESVESLPLHVLPASASRAIFLTDSGPFLGHSPRDKPRLWDVTLYGSDASKLAWLAGSDAVEEIATRFTPIMHDLLGYCDRYGNIYGSPPIFALRATVWRARIAAILNETDYESELRGVYESLERREPLAT
jgi:hypothetical protein